MNKFRDYTCRTRKENAGIAFMGVAAAVTGVGIILKGVDAYIGFFLFLPCFILLWSFSTNGKRMNSFFKDLEDRGILQEVLQDFSESKEYANGGCRLGKKYLYRRKLMSVLSYSDIGDMEISKKLGDTGTEYSLFYKRSDGMYEKICSLEGENAEEKGKRLIAAIEERAGKSSAPEDPSLPETEDPSIPENKDPSLPETEAP